MVLPNAVVSKHVKATYIEYCGLALPAWGGTPIRTPKNRFFERFYIIKSNWKNASLFCLLFPLASCCRTLPWDKGKKKYCQHVTVTLLCLLFALASCCRTLPWDKGKKKYYQHVTVTLLGLFPSTPNIL